MGMASWGDIPPHMYSWILVSQTEKWRLSKLVLQEPVHKKMAQVSNFVMLGIARRSASECWFCKLALSVGSFLKAHHRSIEMGTWKGQDMSHEPRKLPFLSKMQTKKKARLHYTFLLIKICVCKCIAKDKKETNWQLSSLPHI